MTIFTTPQVQAGQTFSRERNLLTVVLVSILIACAGPIAIPLPFTPVPLALQPHMCLLAGAFLGSKRGALAVLGFLAQGVAGFPVFAKGGCGLAYLCGPTGGYLLGYLVGAFATGYLVERMREERTTRKVFAAMAAGNLIIYALGSLHLSHFVGASRALLLGVCPFVLGDFLKLTIAGKLLKTLKFCR